jgi:hypothetical protein
MIIFFLNLLTIEPFRIEIPRILFRAVRDGSKLLQYLLTYQYASAGEWGEIGDMVVNAEDRSSTMASRAERSHLPPCCIQYVLIPLVTSAEIQRHSCREPHTIIQIRTSVDNSFLKNVRRGQGK